MNEFNDMFSLIKYKYMNTVQSQLFACKIITQVEHFGFLGNG